ncbi:MAG: hypothetical protein L0G46_06280 [Kocuria sp.]|nr:hypothetical protein [Kocuria sp.]
MITRRQLVTTAAMVTAAVASGCTKEPEPEPTALPTPSDSDPSSESAKDNEHPELSPAPTGDASSAAASDHAIATLEAFWATSKTQDQWYEDLAVLMTPAGGEPFQYTRIENIVPSKVTAEPTVTFLDEGNTAEVTVPSAHGDWKLTLYRDAAGWLTESIRFPKEEG